MSFSESLQRRARKAGIFTGGLILGACVSYGPAYMGAEAIIGKKTQKTLYEVPSRFMGDDPLRDMCPKLKNNNLKYEVILQKNIPHEIVIGGATLRYDNSSLHLRLSNGESEELANDFTLTIDDSNENYIDKNARIYRLKKGDDIDFSNGRETFMELLELPRAVKVEISGECIYPDK